MNKQDPRPELQALAGCNVAARTLRETSQSLANAASQFNPDAIDPDAAVALYVAICETMASLAALHESLGEHMLTLARAMMSNGIAVPKGNPGSEN